MWGWVMAETKPSDQAEKPLRAPEVKPLGSSDAQQVATPTAQDKQIAEADRTNQSSGSLTELALKTRGLTREQIAAQMDAQGDSISIDYGNGQEASRKTGLTEKSLVQVGGKTYDAKTVVAYEPQNSSGIVSDATNAAVYETDKSKIAPKQVEVEPKQINAGLDYNKESLPLSQRLGMFAQSAEARLMDPAARKAYFQGMIDKAIGVGVGLNEVKEEIKDSAKMAASKARTALEDGSVASFLAQPNAINEPLFKTIGICFDAMRKDPNAVDKVLSIMGRELEAANNKYTNMTPYERGVQDGKAMFFFINPSGSTGSAFKVVDSVAAKVDPLVEKAIQDGLKAAEKLAKESPEYARKAQKMVLDYAREHGLTPKQLETIGVPNEYLEGVGSPRPAESIKTSDTINAMSKADDLGAEAKAGDIQSGGQRKPAEVMKETPVSANGEPLKFDPSANVEVRVVESSNPKAWDNLGRSPRGKEFHVEMGENLPTNHIGIDHWEQETGIGTSFKTRDLRTDSYKTYKGLYSQLKTDVYDLQTKWKGYIQTDDFNAFPRDVTARRLDVAIPDGVMNSEQKRAIEDIAREAAQENILFRVTVIK